MKKRDESPLNLERYKDLKNPDFDKFLKQISSVPKSEVDKFISEKEKKLPRGKQGNKIEYPE